MNINVVKQLAYIFIFLCSHKEISKRKCALFVHHPFNASLIFCKRPLLASSASLKHTFAIRYSLNISWNLHKRLYRDLRQHLDLFTLKV